MTQLPFSYLPRSRFLLRLVVPGALLLVLGYTAVGVVSVQPAFRAPQPIQWDRVPQSSESENDPQVPQEPQGSRISVPHAPLKQASGYYASLNHDLRHVPPGCWTGEVPSEFQRGKCQEFWAKTLVRLALALLPLGLILILYFVAMDSMSLLYRRTRKRVEKGKFLSRALVTHPVKARIDFFGRLYCLKCIVVELPTRAQMKVYFAPEQTLPLPGETVLLVEMGTAFGRKRYAAVFYAPHMTVISAKAR